MNFFSESTFPDGGLNGAENGSLTNHSAKNGNSSVNDTEGRVHKIYLADYFSGQAKGLHSADGKCLSLKSKTSLRTK